MKVALSLFLFFAALVGRELGLGAFLVTLIVLAGILIIDS